MQHSLVLCACSCEASWLAIRALKLWFVCQYAELPHAHLLHPQPDPLHPTSPWHMSLPPLNLVLCHASQPAYAHLGRPRKDTEVADSMVSWACLFHQLCSWHRLTKSTAAQDMCMFGLLVRITMVFVDLSRMKLHPPLRTCSLAWPTTLLHARVYIATSRVDLGEAQIQGFAEICNLLLQA